MSNDDRKTSAQRGYGSRWQRYRDGFLRKNPLCEECTRIGRLTVASVVDHVKPHRGDQALFWDSSNHQALCKHCHDSFKKRLEASGKVAGCDISGLPLDVRHHWHRGV
jgi:5-methylcytosine-specific restriction endonuclease McrA